MTVPNRPKHPKNPVGQTDKIRRARSVWSKHADDVQRWMLERFDKIQTQEIEANASRYVVNRYEYLISASALEEFITELLRRLKDAGVNRRVWEEIRKAYEAGTGDQVANLQSITDGRYERTVLDVIRDIPWQRRVSLIQARVFEEMEGFEDETGRELSRVLRVGVENGLGPREVADDIRERFDVSKSRANRIARTEITQAYRRARIDENEDAQQRLGITTRMLWFSARSETTRQHHARRHGLLYTSDEVREFYSEGANAINCKCSQASILVDENGKPRNPEFVEKVRAQYTGG